ncbi:hypothetical protein BS50DRAFT_570106 [Corynespora cassiicola Philippines]|uniref:Uncharacterized protein n=1 Tax=Corynespora cassiicola Philippines TaxID=1448308 RepID=A0A2T2P5Q5_CORCC|nr:hypothetical protein BS50DRAFT_570106 [Corynespora cassiicola Philippines]
MCSATEAELLLRLFWNDCGTPRRFPLALLRAQTPPSSCHGSPCLFSITPIAIKQSTSYRFGEISFIGTWARSFYPATWTNALKIIQRHKQQRTDGCAPTYGSVQSVLWRETHLEWKDHSADHPATIIMGCHLIGKEPCLPDDFHVQKRSRTSPPWNVYKRRIPTNMAKWGRQAVEA